MTIVAAKQGDAVTFSSRTQFGDAVGSGVSGQTQYLARHGDHGWNTRSITPMSRPDALQTLLASTKVELFSDDLRNALVWGYDLPGVDNDTPDRENLYLQDTETKTLRPLTVSQVGELTFVDFLDPNVWGVSADAKHVGLVTATQMLPDAAPGVSNIYKSDDGQLSLAGVLPDGSVPASGSTVDAMNYRGAMSADGSRLAFVATPDGGSSPQLYLHIDGARSVWVSEPEGADRSEPQSVVFQGMTPDGRNVFFVSDSPLVDGDTSPGPDLYRWTTSSNPANDSNLTLISNNGAVPGQNVGYGDGLVGMSDDGTRVYYQTITDDLTVWDDGITHPIGAPVVRSTNFRRQLAVTTWGPGFGRVTPDGMYLAFLSNSTSGYDGVHAIVGGSVTNGHDELYVYGLRDHSFRCVSCPSVPASTDASVVPGVTSGLSITYTAARPRFLSDDGQVFFSTAESLLPQDTNGVDDTYEYNAVTGVLELLSTGKGSIPSTFADASASGDDVFLVTRQQLTSSDRDSYVDLYDVRVGPPPPGTQVTDMPPCDGEGCQDPPTTAPGDDPLGSASFDGPGVNSPILARLSARHRAAFRGATGALPVKLNAAGRLRWSGRGLVQGSARRGRAGTVKVRLRLGSRARAHLKQSGTYTTNVRLTFLASAGSSARGTIRVTFRAVAKKGR